MIKLSFLEIFLYGSFLLAFATITLLAIKDYYQTTYENTSKSTAI